MAKVEEFDRKVGAHRDEGDCIPVATAKAIKETLRDRRRGRKS